MSVIHGANYGTPTLDLNFAKNKSLIDTISGQNLVTFTRSSTGTYVDSDGLIKTASVNTPRFNHNPLTGECLGLLVEEARTNLLRYTTDVGNASSSWISNSSGITAISNNAISPDGQLTATFVRESSSNENHYIRHTSGHLSLANTVHTYSAYLKPNGRRYVIFFCDIASIIARFDLLGPTSSTNINVGNGWRRVSFQYTSDSSSPGNNSLFIGMEDANYTNFVYGSNPYAGDGASGIYVWGVQCEAGTFPTSYIPTAGSTVTRSADVMSITGTNFSRWYNNTEGTFFTNAILAFTQNAGNPFTFGGVFYTTVANFSGDLRTLANAGIMGGVLPTSLTSFSKTAVALKSGDFASAVSGSINGTSSLSYTPTGTEFRINSSLGSLALINRLTYYPTRLQNYQLQQLTK